VREVSPDPQLYDLVPFTAGEMVFAVFADQVESTADAKLPAPLPDAPPGVLGVVCVRGRMLTVLDPLALVTGEANSWPESLPNIIALSGDEQLALAAMERLDTITISAADIESPSLADEENLSRVALGIARYGGQEITVLSVAHLFAAALRRKERRRRRF
jgi:chemotaxis signal transduction protein